MTRSQLQSGIEQRANTNLRIASELADIVEFVISNGHVPGNDAIRTPDLKAKCPAASYNRVERLVHEMGMLLKFKQGPDTYLIHTRKDEIVNGQNVSAMVNVELGRIAKHAGQDPAVRRVVGGARNMPSQPLQGLTNGNFAARRERLEVIIDAIQAAPNVSQGQYGKIIFRTPANLYRASPIAIQLYR